MKTFDKKFGKEFHAKIPREPGIYLIYNRENALIYVGKAKNLSRRLNQYRNAKRLKKHAKMRSIVSEAHRIELRLCGSDLEACRAEAKIIQEERPKWNVAGAFHFLYPMIGICSSAEELSFFYSTDLSAIPLVLQQKISWHGAYRSRHFAGEAFFSLMELFQFIGHRNPTQKWGKYSYHYSFRQLSKDWQQPTDRFLRGETNNLLEQLILALLEFASARRKSKDVQAHIRNLNSFWKHEALPLQRATHSLNFAYPVSQKDRDFLFLDYRFLKKEKRERKRVKAQNLSRAEVN